MKRKRWLQHGLLAAALFTGVGCALPAGTAVFVDIRAGDFWSGKGELLEVSADQRRCRVAVRDRALIPRELWVDCNHIHPRAREATRA